MAAQPMNYATWIFLGAFATFASSWLGLVFFPNLQMKDLQVIQDEAGGEVHPSPLSGEAEFGRAVYIAEGCIYCHTQQVRGGDYNADLARGWGMRRSHPRDYIFQTPQLLGTMRTGPDLANIGVRQPSDEWHYLHLYDPQITSKGSIMPPYPFLFERRRIEGESSQDALSLPGDWKPPQGEEIVPTRRGRALVAYLKSLRQDYDVP